MHDTLIVSASAVASAARTRKRDLCVTQYATAAQVASVTHEATAPSTYELVSCSTATGLSASSTASAVDQPRDTDASDRHARAAKNDAAMRTPLPNAAMPIIGKTLYATAPSTH